MNILFLAISANIKTGTGEAIHMRELAINLAKLGHHVSLIAGYSPDASDELYALENHPNIKLYYNKNIFKIQFLRLQDLSGILTCLKVAHENPPDVIYERSFSCKFGTILSKILRKPFVVEINGLADEEAKLQGTYKSSKYTKNLRMKFRRFFFNSANKIVAVSPGIKEELQKRYHIPQDKIVVITNGADTELFRPMDQATVKKELGLSQKNKYICFVGKLAPWQGVEYLVQAAPIVLEKVPEARFFIVGNGMMRNELEGMVKKLDLQDMFVFTGNVPFEVVPKYINVSDVCVAPFSGIERNVKYGFSAIKLYEYMACARPFVTTSVCGITEEIVNNQTGLVVDVDSPEDLAEAIIYLLIENEKRSEMGKNGREYVLEGHRWKNTAEMVIKTCESVIT